MKIRAYHFGEEHQIWQLFYQTIHKVNAANYSQKQIDAWAPNDFDQQFWQEKLAALGTFVCVNSSEFRGNSDKKDSTIFGYSDLQSDGYIDHFFCHHQHQGKGIGNALMVHIHRLAINRGITELSADVSITALDFFKKYGFKIVKSQNVLIRGQILGNYKMRKSL
ncbi:GNAT family N-acetyltransferase [Paraglaciecola arctica]|uniref:GNAT family N-acetyltransferase n=1 Tax=Paraglaciecola arctica TaxID=1128911 RepID=UPI001C073858|nr:GNAT family N-acetyltransferase [Paraglaciecola arctica]MBU3002901.1 GNAT family N-acetyltransferase [Paraglaciecola arctica]